MNTEPTGPYEDDPEGCTCPQDSVREDCPVHAGYWPNTRGAQPARSPVDDALDRLVQACEEAEGADLDAGYKDAKARFDSRMVDVATVREALERLRERVEQDREWRREFLERAESAEAEVRRLTEGLREYLRKTEARGDNQARMKLRALLSASPTDGGGA